jgi:hypothetical protein
MASRNKDADKENQPRRRDGDDKEEFSGEPQTPSEADDSEADDSDDEFDDSDDADIDDDTEGGSDDGTNA